MQEEKGNLKQRVARPRRTLTAAESRGLKVCTTSGDHVAAYRPLSVATVSGRSSALHRGSEAVWPGCFSWSSIAPAILLDLDKEVCGVRFQQIASRLAQGVERRDPL